MFLTRWFPGLFQQRRGLSPRLAAKRHVPTNYNMPVKSEDNQQAMRERLYFAIRDAMAIGGVLSASYKFKVLAVDSSAQSFLVMIDLNHMVGERAAGTAELETLVVQKARTMYNVLVSGVYWRINEVELPSKMNLAKPVLPVPAPTAAPAQPIQSKPIYAQPLDIRKAEQIDPDELTAFHHALRSASVRSAATSRAKGAAKSKGATPAASFEFNDTVMEESETGRYPALSTTQYGDL